MKCITCNKDIIVHNNILSKTDKPLTYLDTHTRGMIYTESGLIHYTHNKECEVCSTEEQ